MKYKKFIISSLVTALTLFLLMEIILLSNKYIGTNDLELITFIKRDWIRSNISESSSNKKLVIALGDSKIASSFLPDIFDKELNYKTFSLNLAMVTHDVTRNLYVLQDFLKFNRKPDYILMYISYERLLLNSLNENWEERLYYHKKSKNNIFIKDYFFPAINKNKVNNAFINVAKLISLNKERNESVDHMLNDKGAYFWLGKYTSIGEKKKFSDLNIDPDKNIHEIKKNYLYEIEKFLKFTTENKIKVIIIFPPLVENTITINNLPKEYIEMKKKYPLLEISKMTKAEYSSELFMTRGHTNYIGAKEYSKDLANSIDSQLRIK
jgi:hypothetical protein